ncbi:hypothetical protein ACFFTN_13715 [Aminobacter aganoensis]|uniref:Uncharacterized protein n=1 Tax=Aminobacter aganoensis TaxID=83264 RepID=A0A7X0FCQ7_9HYPH|nr:MULTISPECIES: hypothetical protein [Aminobacter]KQU73758.1 hypothetical protein ASC75_22445 [Aminobacter sp. DSM 101952]MBB6357339.1 hypothetical protein [Aminobacter aganoensis]
MDAAPTITRVGGAEIDRIDYLGEVYTTGQESRGAYSQVPGLFLNNTARSSPNCLDWYEEGSFTPTFSFASGTTGMTLGAQTGNFTRIGNMVMFRLSGIYR